ncbi:energy transducer TonB [Pseudidiomarina sp.]|uniref:energy transducer TonB n=1 Tax=Pseudidiomarina sp. TaxID=2081707 RepID=UPI00299DC8AF|nr:energy transducer TonB [Pseudidiomarina sp.]MDX1706642.1 energy transducer TonB [Pseudidiomarina sp.]
MAKLSKAALAVALLLTIDPAVADEQGAAGFEQHYSAYQEALDAQLPNSKIAPLAKQAYLSGAKYFGPDDINTAKLKINYLAVIHTDDLRSEPSQKLAEEVLAVYRKEYGQSAPEVVDVLLIALGTHNLEATKAYYDDLVRIADANMQQQPEYMFRAKVEAASHLLSIGSPVSRDLVELAETAEQRFGPEHELTLLANFHAGRYLEAKNDADEAIERFKKVAAADEGVLPPGLVTAKYLSHARLVHFLEKEGKSDEATEHCLAISKMGFGIQDERDPKPLYRVNPRYPVLLVSRGLEGDVSARYDITESGFVENVEITEYSDRAFVKTSEDAIKQWRFAPRIVDGKPVTAKGYTVKLVFALD